MQKRRLGPCVTFFPQPTTLVSTQNEKGEVNLMTASWAGIVSKTPPTMAVSLHQNRLTYANIRETGTFGVNLVPAHLAVEADFCGLASGKTVAKLEGTGLHVAAGEATGAPLVVESPLNVECRYVQEVALGDYRLVLGEIVEIYALEQAFDASGKADAQAFDPLVYLGGIREYWGLGRKCADAYRDGAALLPDKEA